MSPRRRVLLLHEVAAEHLLGPAMASAAIEAGLAAADDLDLVVRAARPSRAGALAARAVPVLSRYDLDLQVLRWHLVHGALVRRLAEEEERRRPLDAAVVNTHTLSLLLGRFMELVPTVLEVDLTMEQLHRFAMWRRWMPWARAALAPSLELERRRFAQAATVVAQSTWVADAVVRTCPSASVEVINPGIDLDRFRPAPRSDRPRPRLLFVAARFAAKGGLDLLMALRGHLGREVDLDVVTRDDVPVVDGVKVHRLDPGPALVELFQQADLFVLPSHADGNPWVVLEALACGVPVVATDVGAIPEMVQEGGRVVPVRDVDALRCTIVELVQDADQRGALGEAGRAAVEARYDRRVQGARLAATVRGVAHRPGTGDARR